MNYIEKLAKTIVNTTKVRGVKIHRFYKGKWQDTKKPYRFKDYRKDNPAAIMRDILIRSGIYDLPNFDKEQADKVLGQMYLYCNEKVSGIVIDKPLLKGA